jgi:hypothetical protein
MRSEHGSGLVNTVHTLTSDCIRARLIMSSLAGKSEVI